MRLVIRTILFTAIIVAIAACTSKPTKRGSDAEIASINLELGINYYRQGKLDRAEEKLKTALDADNDSASAHNMLALVYSEQGLSELAEEHYRKSLQLVDENSPDFASFNNNYGVFLCDQGKYKQAQEKFVLAINHPRYQSPQTALENAGLCAQAAGEKGMAEGYFRQSLQHDPRLPRALFAMAQLYFEKKSYLQVRAYIQRLHEVEQPTAASLWLGLRAERQLGNESAVNEYAQILTKQFPDSNETARYMETLEGRN